VDGCPLGLSLIAARGNDTMLLALAKNLLGRQTLRPPRIRIESALKPEIVQQNLANRGPQ
jgi:hypothetical protein